MRSCWCRHSPCHPKSGASHHYLRTSERCERGTYWATDPPPKINTKKGKGLNFPQVGAGIQLPPNCTRIFEKWGVLSTIESYATSPSNITLRSYKDGQVLFKRSARVHAQGTLQAPHLFLHRADLLKCLVEEALRLGVTFRFDATVRRIDFGKATTQLLDDEEEDAYDVIFGADGSQSVTRGLLFGNSHGPQLSGEVAYRVMVPVEEVEEDKELSVFAKDSDVSCWMGPDAHVVCYRLEKEDMVNVVLVGPDQLPAFTDSAHSEEQEMEARFANWDPRLQKLLRLAKTVLKRRLQGSHEMASWGHPDGKFALVGDACHTTLPTL